MIEAKEKGRIQLTPVPSQQRGSPGFASPGVTFGKLLILPDYCMVIWKMVLGGPTCRVVVKIRDIDFKPWSSISAQ